MCDRCEARMGQSLTALEALANGEELPGREALPEGATPVPMLVIEMGPKIGIITSREGWEALKALLSGIIPLDGD